MIEKPPFVASSRIFCPCWKVCCVCACGGEGHSLVSKATTSPSHAYTRIHAHALAVCGLLSFQYSMIGSPTSLFVGTPHLTSNTFANTILNSFWTLMPYEEEQKMRGAFIACANRRAWHTYTPSHTLSHSHTTHTQTATRTVTHTHSSSSRGQMQRGETHAHKQSVTFAHTAHCDRLTQYGTCLRMSSCSAFS